MEKSKLKELVKQVMSEYLDEMSTSGAAGGYLGKKAFKPKELDEAVGYSTPKAFDKSSNKIHQDFYLLWHLHHENMEQFENTYQSQLPLLIV